MRPQRFLATLVLGAGVAVSSFAQESSTTGSTGGWRRIANGDETQTAAPAPAYNEQQQPPNYANNPPRPVPGHILIPAGTWIQIRVDQLLSSQYNQPGDVFGATLMQPIIADGFVVARRGQMISGRITEVVKAGRVKGTSRLGIELNEIGLADGQLIPVRTQLVEFSAGTSRGNDTAIIGTTTGAGAAIGAAAAGGFGAGMGAIAGAGASAIGVLLSRGRNTEVPPESVMRFRLTEQIAVNTERAQHAFQAVQQSDYDSRSQQPRMAMRQPAYYGGGGGWYGGYSPWLWGPSYGWGWGPGWGWGSGYSLFYGRGWYGGGRGWYGGGRGWYGGGGGFRGGGPRGRR
jgi:hypothetical protein